MIHDGSGVLFNLNPTRTGGVEVLSTTPQGFLPITFEAMKLRTRNFVTFPKL